MLTLQSPVGALLVKFTCYQLNILGHLSNQFQSRVNGRIGSHFKLISYDVFECHKQQQLEQSESVPLFRKVILILSLYIYKILFQSVLQFCFLELFIIDIYLDILLFFPLLPAFFVCFLILHINPPNLPAKHDILNNHIIHNHCMPIQAPI